MQVHDEEESFLWQGVGGENGFAGMHHGLYNPKKICDPWRESPCTICQSG